MPGPESSSPAELTLVPYSQIILAPEEFDLPSDFAELQAIHTPAEDEFFTETNRDKSYYTLEEENGARWSIKSKKLKNQTLFYKVVENAETEIKLPDLHKELQRFCFDSKLLFEYLLGEVFTTDEANAAIYTKTAAVLTEAKMAFIYKKNSEKLKAKTLIKQTTDKSIEWTRTNFYDLTPTEDHSDWTGTKTKSNDAADCQLEVTATVQEKDGKITRKFEPLCISILNHSSTRLLNDRAPSQYKPKIIGRNISLELQDYIESSLTEFFKSGAQQANTDKQANSSTKNLDETARWEARDLLRITAENPTITTDNVVSIHQDAILLIRQQPATPNEKKQAEQANHIVKILEAQKKYWGKDEKNSMPSSTQQYLAELRQINNDYKPGLIENLFGVLNIKKTKRYEAYYSLKNKINAIETNWLANKTVKLNQLEKKISQETDKPESIIDELHLGSTALKLGKFDKAQTVYTRITSRLGKEIKNNVKEIKSDFEKINTLTKQRLAVIKQLNQLVAKTIKYDDLKLLGNSKEIIAQFANCSNEQLQEEINTLNELIQSITSATALSHKNATDEKPPSAFTLPAFLAHVATNQYAPEEISSLLMAELNNRQNYLKLKLILSNNNPQTVLDSLDDTDKLMYQNLLTEKENIREELQTLKASCAKELDKVKVESPLVYNFLSATQQAPRQHIKTNHSRFMDTMDNFHQIEQVFDQLNDLFGEDKEEETADKALKSTNKPTP